MLTHEFATLRRGRGIMATDLRDRLGPELVRLCDIPATAGNSEIRERVIETVHRLYRALPDGDRTVIDIALGADRAAQFVSLKTRTRYLAVKLCVADRTARRRIEHAFELLADEAIAHGTPADRTAADDPERGWEVRTFDALFRLDTPGPELTEQRTIVATHDQVRSIAVRLSLPRMDGDGPPAPDMVFADVQQGARIARRERQGEGHYRYLLDLPRPLARGEEHSYTIAFRLPPDRPIRPHYAFVPLVACREFRVRVRFDPAKLPAAVWRLDRLPPRVLADRLAPGAPLCLDAAAEVSLAFADVERGFGYGIAWQP